MVLDLPIYNQENYSEKLSNKGWTTSSCPKVLPTNLSHFPQEIPEFLIEQPVYLRISVFTVKDKAG